MSALEWLESRSAMRSRNMAMETSNDIYEMSSMQQSALYPNSVLEQQLSPSTYDTTPYGNNNVLPCTQPTVRMRS